MAMDKQPPVRDSSGAAIQHPTDQQLRSYHLISLSTSGGKDSSVMLELAARRAQAAGCLDRCVAVHADLEELEWEGAKALAERQAARFGIPFVLARNTSRWRTWLDYAVHRGDWPRGGGKGAIRYCTRQWKTGPIEVLWTQLKEAHYRATGVRPFRILNVVGLRREEGGIRSKLEHPYTHDLERTNSHRLIDTWLPVLDWTADEIWRYIDEHQVEPHPAYALGMPRLSCVICPLAGKDAAMLSASYNREILRRFVEVERLVGKPMNKGYSAAGIEKALRAGVRPTSAAVWKD